MIDLYNMDSKKIREENFLIQFINTMKGLSKTERNKGVRAVYITRWFILKEK